MIADAESLYICETYRELPAALPSLNQARAILKKNQFHFKEMRLVGGTGLEPVTPAM
jgi:hypothetical protein